MTGTDDRLDEYGDRIAAESYGGSKLGLERIAREMLSELRDARAEIAEAKRLLTDMNCERDHWQFAYEEAVQRAEQAESDLREAKAQHAIDENELVENTVKAHVQQMNVVAAELAAERAKVERVEHLCTARETFARKVVPTFAIRRALTGEADHV